MKEKDEKFNEYLKKSTIKRGLIIPVIFAVIAVILCIIMSSSSVGIFPSGNHDDALTTTKPTQTTEYIEQ